MYEKENYDFVEQGYPDGCPGLSVIGFDVAVDKTIDFFEVVYLRHKYFIVNKS